MLFLSLNSLRERLEDGDAVAVEGERRVEHGQLARVLVDAAVAFAEAGATCLFLQRRADAQRVDEQPAGNGQL